MPSRSWGECVGPRADSARRTSSGHSDRVREAKRDAWMIQRERVKSRTREPRESNRSVGLHRRRACRLTKEGELAEVIAGSNASEIELTPTHPSRAVEHEVHQLARLA